MKIVTTTKGKIIADQSAETKEGDFLYDKEAKYTRRLNSKHNETDFDIKIIASINFSLDKDVPMVIVEDEILKLALIEYPISLTIDDAHYQGDYDANEDDRNIWIKGFKAAQQKGVYSEAAMRKYHNTMCLHGNVAGEKFIQSLNQETIELEKEYLSNDGIWKCVLLPSEWEVDTKNRIKTDRVDGQLIAYVKTNNV